MRLADHHRRDGLQGKATGSSDARAPRCHVTSRRRRAAAAPRDGSASPACRCAVLTAVSNVARNALEITAGDEVAVQVDGVRDLALPEDERQLGELGAGARQQQPRRGGPQVVEGQVPPAGGAGRTPGVSSIPVPVSGLTGVTAIAIAIAGVGVGVGVGGYSGYTLRP